MDDNLTLKDVLRISTISITGTGWNKEFVVDDSDPSTIWFKVINRNDQICCTQNLALAINMYNEILPKEYDDRNKIGKHA